MRWRRWRGRGLRLRIRPRIQLPRIRSIISPADTLTLTNALMGFLAIVTLMGDPGREAFGRYSDTLFAAVLIGIGMLADALDGIVARKWGASSLGGDLDTLADATTFVLAPALLVVHTYGEQASNGSFPVRAVLVAGLVVLMGLMRLARFNANPVEGENTTFQGLPTPVSAGAIVVLVLVDAPARFALAIVTVVALLMMSNVPYPKSRGSVVKFSLVLVAAGAFILAGILFLPARQNFFIAVAFALVSFVVAVSPFLLRLRQARESRLAEEGEG